MVGDARPRRLAGGGGGLGLEGERRRAVELVGDQPEEDLADPRRGERRAELLEDRPVGLDHPLGDDPLARDQPGAGRRLALLADRQRAGSIPRWGAASRAEDAVAGERPERRGDLRVQLVPPGGRVGGRLELGEDLGPELPGRPDVLAQLLEPGGLGDRHGQVVQALGQLADRRRVVDHRRRDLVGGRLPLVAGLGLVADPELLDVDPELAVGALADPVGERRPGAVDDRRGGQQRDDHQRQPRGPGALRAPGDLA